MTRLARVLVLAGVLGWPGAVAAQTTFQRGWIDVNFGAAAAAEKRFHTGTRVTVDLEPADFDAEYPLPRGASFDFGGGVMITPQVGVGVSFSGTAHEETADLSIRIPHPFFFDAFASDTAPTEERLLRAEGGVHLQLMVVAYDRNNVRVRFFAGPSRLRVTQEAVENILYNQVYGVFTRANAVDIVEYEASEIEGTGWGMHAGGDVSWFFTRVVGIGGFARVSRATVELDDPLDEAAFRIKAGGVQAGAGLRLRF
jgi:hypothetical protein